MQLNKQVTYTMVFITLNEVRLWKISNWVHLSYSKPLQSPCPSSFIDTLLDPPLLFHPYGPCSLSFFFIPIVSIFEQDEYYSCLLMLLFNLNK